MIILSVNLADFLQQFIAIFAAKVSSRPRHVRNRHHLSKKHVQFLLNSYFSFLKNVYKNLFELEVANRAEPKTMSKKNWSRNREITRRMMTRNRCRSRETRRPSKKLWRRKTTVQTLKRPNRTKWKCSRPKSLTFLKFCRKRYRVPLRRNGLRCRGGHSGNY